MGNKLPTLRWDAVLLRPLSDYLVTASDQVLHRHAPYVDQAGEWEYQEYRQTQKQVDFEDECFMHHKAGCITLESYQVLRPACEREH